MSLRYLPFCLLTLATFALTASLQAEELKLDKEESKISFVGGKPDGSTHEGGFKKFDVAAIADFQDPTKSSINITIDTSSLWADDERLANHLKSPDFFDVRKHPTITFESTEIVPKENNESGVATATIKGDMHMLGKKVAVDIPIEATVTEQAVDMKANFKIDRTKWGMTYGEGKINDDVKVSVQFMLKR